MATILVVDDDPDIRDVIHIYLRNEGHTVIEAENGRAAIDKINEHTIHLIILDVMMPVMDGIQACIHMRKQTNIPIIMLSAKEEDIDKIIGLTTGADDYMVKPFNPLELLARVQAQLRRQRLTSKEEVPAQTMIIEIRDLMIDIKKHAVTMKGVSISLTPLEFSILELIASHPGQVFSSNQIYEQVWKEPYGYSDNTVMVHIRNLREKLEVSSKDPQYIKTVWGVGYKIE